MQRICFVLQVKPDRIEEYRRRHNEVWPEMKSALRESGWNNYSLFLREDGLLVGYLETLDFREALAEMERRDVNGCWQRDMAHFFFLSGDTRPDQSMTPLEEIFHIDSV